MSSYTKSKTPLKKKKDITNEDEDQALLEEHKDPNKTSYSNTHNYIGVTFIWNWGEIYKVFKDEAYPLPFGLPSYEKDLDLYAYENIRRSHFHNVGGRPSIFPYIKMVKWVLIMSM